MKKILLFLVLIITSIGFASCSCSNSKSSISYAENEVVIYENEVYEINKNKIYITGKEGDYSISSLNEDIATIEDFSVIPHGVGKTTIRFKIDKKKDVYFDISFEVKEGKIAKDVSVENSIINIEMSDTMTARNKITTNLDCTEIPIVEYDNNIIDYDINSGVITAKDVGQTKVKITYIKCYISFDVNVTKVIYTSHMIINNPKVYANSEGKLDFQVFPTNANTYYFSLTNKDKDREDFIIHSDGTFKSYDATTISLNYFYYTSKNNRSEIYSVDVEIVDRLEDFNVDFYDENNNITKNFLINKEYKIIAKISHNLGVPQLTISGDFSENSSLQFEEGVGYKMSFKFDTNGSKKITILYDLKLGNVSNVIEKNFELNVRDKSIVTPCVKWSIYDLSVDSENRYVIYLDGQSSSSSDSAIFKLKVDGIIDNTLDFSVYQILADGQKKLLENKTFKPTSTGEYVFEVEFEGESLGEITILVK